MAIEIKETIKVESAEAVRKTREVAAETEKLGKARKKASEASGGGGSGAGDGLTAQERNRLAEDLRRVREAVSNYNRKNGIIGDRALQNQKEAAKAVIEEAQSRARNIGRTIADEMSRRSAGAIGKMVAGFVAHEGVSMMFAAVRNPLGGNQKLDVAEGAINGAIGGATSGAMVGGPWGAVIGGVLGGGGAALSKVIEQGKDRDSRVWERGFSDRTQRRNMEDNAADSAFGKLIENMSREGKIAAMQSRRSSLESLRAEADAQLDRKDIDPTSYQFRDLSARRAELQNRIMTLEQSIESEKMNIPLGRMMDVGSVADSYAKRGLVAGAQVDVGQVNDKILTKLTEGVGYFKQVAERLPKVGELSSLMRDAPRNVGFLDGLKDILFTKRDANGFVIGK